MEEVKILMPMGFIWDVQVRIGFGSQISRQHLEQTLRWGGITILGLRQESELQSGERLRPGEGRARGSDKQSFESSPLRVGVRGGDDGNGEVKEAPEGGETL